MWCPLHSLTLITSAEATGLGDTMLLVDLDVLGMTLGALIVDWDHEKQASKQHDALQEYMLLVLFVAKE